MDSALQKQVFPLSDLIRSVLLCFAVGFVISSIFGSAKELATLSYNFKYNFHVPMLSLQVSEADQRWTWMTAESLTDYARTLSIAKSMIEHGANGAMAGIAVGFALFASQWNARKRSETGILSTNIPLVLVLTLTLLASAGLYIYRFRSDYVVLIMSAQFVCEWLLLVVAAFPPFLLIGGLSVLLRRCFPGRLASGHWLEAMPWITSFGTLVWGFYWGFSPSSEMPRPESDGWIGIPILLSFPIILIAWILLICRRRSERLHMLALCAAHLLFQFPVAFVAGMSAMKDCI